MSGWFDADERWQWLQWWQEVLWNSEGKFFLIVVMSLIAGPSLIPITEVRCVSVSFGKQDPSIRLSEKSWNEAWVSWYKNIIFLVTPWRTVHNHWHRPQTLPPPRLTSPWWVSRVGWTPGTGIWPPLSVSSFCLVNRVDRLFDVLYFPEGQEGDSYFPTQGMDSGAPGYSSELFWRIVGRRGWAGGRDQGAPVVTLEAPRRPCCGHCTWRPDTACSHCMRSLPARAWSPSCCWCCCCSCWFCCCFTAVIRIKVGYQLGPAPPLLCLEPAAGWMGPIGGWMLCIREESRHLVHNIVI